MPVNFIRAVPAGRPIATVDYFDRKLLGKLSRYMTVNPVDIYQIEHSFFVPYVDAVPGNGTVRCVLSLHNIGETQYKSMINIQRRFDQKAIAVLKWMFMKNWERQWARKFDHCIVVSPLDKQYLAARPPLLDTSIIENGVDAEKFKPLAQPRMHKTILFVGTMGYGPNADAVLYFSKHILPRIRENVPDVQFVIAGHHPPPHVKQLETDPDIRVTGYVKDVCEVYEKAVLSVVPLRAGGGTRLKILESMALGRPVVSTSAGCEGLTVTHEKNILVADSPVRFANAVIGLLKDASLRNRIATNARDIVEKEYDWKHISEKLLSLYQRIKNEKNVA